MREVRFRLRNDDYDTLAVIAKSHGYKSVNEFVKDLVLKLIYDRVVIDRVSYQNLLRKIDEIGNRVDKLCGDQVDQGRINELEMKVSRLEDLVMELREELNELKNKLRGTLLFKVR